MKLAEIDRVGLVLTGLPVDEMIERLRGVK